MARRGLNATLPLATAALHQLTARESEIAALVSTGMTNSQIAADLGLSVRTVDSHLWRVYHKLGVTNRASLTRLLAHRS
ncbi:response regulator transcription factor [Micromonospora echinospora]